jgi:hypothetical protein
MRNSVVEKRVIESGSRGIGVAGSVVDDVEAGPVAGGQAHGTGLAAGVEFAALKREGTQGLASGANGVHFAVRCGVVAGRDGVDAFANDAGRRGQRPRRTGRLCRRVDVPNGQRNGATQKLRDWAQ